MSSMRVDMNNLTRFVSLEDAGLEEPAEQPLFGLMGAESTRHSIYSYVEWFYDGDTSAFSIM